MCWRARAGAGATCLKLRARCSCTASAPWFRYRVDAYTDIENVQSARVLEKVGMQLEGRLRRYTVHPNLHSEPRDVLLFAACR